ncbi:MAG: hypothetical protein WCJ07_03155 [Verrucomicrobiota bacterium]
MDDIEKQNLQKGMVKTAAGYFLLILLGSLFASLLGGAFGALVAVISPAFVKGLFSLKPEDGNIARYAFTVGMIWGLFIGVGVSGFACLLTTVVKIIRLRIECRKIDGNQ